MEHLIGPELFIKSIEKQTGCCHRIWNKRECKRNVGRTIGERKRREKKITHEWLDWKTEHDPAMCACSPKSQPYLGMQQKAVASRSREVNPCFCSGEDTSGTPWPALESSAQENYGPVRVGSQEGWSTYPMRKGWKSSSYSFWRKGGSEEIFQCLKGAYKKDGK